MVSVASIPSSSENNHPTADTSKMFSSFLLEFYSDKGAHNIKRNDSYISKNMKSKQYHLKHNSNHINTVTNLGSPERTPRNAESNKSINTFLNDFNEFHRAQDINHRKRFSKYENNIHDTPKDKISHPSSPKLTVNTPKKNNKKFSIYTLKQLKLINITPKEKGHAKNSSIDSGASKSSKTNSPHQKGSIKRKKSISYKSIVNPRKNIPLFRSKSKLYSISTFAHNTSTEKLTKTEIFEMITTERLKVLEPSSELSKALFRRIQYNSYKKDHRMVNYSSDINMRSKYDSEQITKPEFERTMEVWQKYLKNMVARKVMENLTYPSKLSPITGGLRKFENTDGLSMNANISDDGESHSSESNSELGSVLEQKINHLINKNRLHASYATTMNNTDFSANKTDPEDYIDEFEFFEYESK